MKYLVILILFKGWSKTKNVSPYDRYYISFLLFLTPFLRTFIIKGNANNGRNPPSCSFPAIMTPFLVIAFINEEAMGSIYEEAIGTINEAVLSAIIAGRNPPSRFFLFHVLLFY